MRTITISSDEMHRRVARFRDLEPLQAAATLDIPQAAKDVIYSRQLLSVIGLAGGAATPINQGAPIRGAGGITMTHAVCPPGTGPSLHAHVQTYETFTVLRGRFEVRWNDNGDCAVELEEFDTISIPPGVCRGFRNIGENDGILQVIISGGIHDMSDIDFPASTARELADYGDTVVDQFKARGLTFTAGLDAES